MVAAVAGVPLSRPRRAACWPIAKPLCDRMQLTWFNRAGRQVGTVGGPDATVGWRRIPTFVGWRRRGSCAECRRERGCLACRACTKCATSFHVQSGSESNPDWSPDGSRIVFALESDRPQRCIREIGHWGFERNLACWSHPMPRTRVVMDWSPTVGSCLYNSISGRLIKISGLCPLRGTGERVPVVGTLFKER